VERGGKVLCNTAARATLSWLFRPKPALHASAVGKRVPYLTFHPATVPDAHPQEVSEELFFFNFFAHLHALSTGAMPAIDASPLSLSSADAAVGSDAESSAVVVSNSSASEATEVCASGAEPGIDYLIKINFGAHTQQPCSPRAHVNAGSWRSPHRTRAGWIERQLTILGPFCCRLGGGAGFALQHVASAFAHLAQARGFDRRRRRV
jgi:hypothetical protein